MNLLEKVTAFITRENDKTLDLLLFRHPTAGTQIPAGTVEVGETRDEAVLREAHEETGLGEVIVKSYIGHLDQTPPEGWFVIAEKTKVYAHPDVTSFDWVEFRRGVMVKEERSVPGFKHVTYEERDRYPDHRFITYRITGWVPDKVLSRKTRRYFYHLTYSGETPATWDVFTDHHIFQLFWAPFFYLPEIIEDQRIFLDFVTCELGYKFE
jgi:8-oxo-dGTP pyrophosphatase MutT (NUDIX family)